MVTLFKFRHREAFHIGIKIPVSSEELSKIRGLDNIKYTKTHRCWYFPYEKVAFTFFQKLAIPYRLESGTHDVLPSKSEPTGIMTKAPNKGAKVINSIIQPRVVQEVDVDIQKNSNSGLVKISWSGKEFRVELKFNQYDTDFLKQLPGSYWNQNYCCWCVRSKVENLKALQSHFSIWEKTAYENLYSLISLRQSPRILKLYVSPQFPNTFLIKTEGYEIDINFLKQISKRQYDKKLKRWKIPLDQSVIKRIVAHYTDQGVKVINRIPAGKEHYKKKIPGNQQRLNRLMSKFKPIHRESIQSFADTLLRQQYGWKTISNYCGKLHALMEFYPNRSLDKLHVEDIQRYLSQLAIKDASYSYLNVVFSAIKLYYSKVAYAQNFDIEKLIRPRKGKNLPTILSIGEVERMLRSVKNLKHLAVLYTIYGGGLRLNEVLHVRSEDIYWERSQIKVHQGKGKKDRMVMLSQSLKQLLERYFDEYKPQYWLFEGADKETQYSSRSIQKIVKRAAHFAGITRKVSPHTLRHCFATHLLDNGTDIRYIQELLGHRDIKTTLIYTHVTTRSLGKVVSPLDLMAAVDGDAK